MGPGTPLNINFFKKISHKLFFHEMTQLEGVRLKTLKRRSNVDHPNSHPPKSQKLVNVEIAALAKKKKKKIKRKEIFIIHNMFA